MRVTENFDSDEWASKDGVPYPAEWIEPILLPHAEMLETIRAVTGRQIYIVSGYRTPSHNAAVGGATMSQHVRGRASDIKISGMSAADAHGLILQLYNEGRLPALGGLGRYPSWTHVDTRESTRLARWTGDGVPQDESSAPFARANDEGEGAFESDDSPGVYERAILLALLAAVVAYGVLS